MVRVTIGAVLRIDPLPDVTSSTHHSAFCQDVLHCNEDEYSTLKLEPVRVLVYVAFAGLRMKM